MDTLIKEIKMRGKVAKRIRKEVYGDKVSGLSMRKYSTDGVSRTIHADPTRKMYQQMKKEYRRWTR